MAEINDDELIRQISLGQMESFEVLVRRHARSIYGLAFHVMGSRALADEISQETWIRVMKASVHYEGRGTARAWLMSICRNLCFNELRKQKWEIEMTPQISEATGSNDPSPEKVMLTAEEKRFFQDALLELPERQRQVLVLSLSGNLTHDQLAKELKLNANALKALIFRARENLKEAVRLLQESRSR